MKQPRVPEYREGDSVSKYLKNLILFLKDFSSEVWVASKSKGASGLEFCAFHIDERGHLICTYESPTQPPLHIDANGHLIYTIGG
jgi:hypothetical protein